MRTDWLPTKWHGMFASALTVVLFTSTQAHAQEFEEQTVQLATQTLDEFMKIPAQSIPRKLLKDAQALAIIPNLVKGGFIVGVRHGNGVIVQRDAKGVWQSPVFVQLTGGSVGLQAGLQATDVILVFRSQRSVNGLLRGKLTIGADASVAAGPIGRQAAIATDGQLKAEILSYSRNRGLFAGVAIDGGVLQVDKRATQAYYTPRPGVPQGRIPQSAITLIERVIQYTGTAQPAAPVPHVTQVPPADPNANVPTVVPPTNPAGTTEIELARQQLLKVSGELHALVDDSWKKYLALPTTLLQNPIPANLGESLQPVLAKYNATATDPRYAALTQRPEFRQTHALIERLVRLQETQSPAQIKLPPPPQ